ARAQGSSRGSVMRFKLPRGPVEGDRGAVALFFLDNPDISVRDWIAVVLQLERTGRSFRGQSAGSYVRQLHVVVNDYAIVSDRHAGVLHFLVSLVEAGGRKLDVVRLPRKRRK